MHIATLYVRRSYIDVKKYLTPTVNIIELDHFCNLAKKSNLIGIL